MHIAAAVLLVVGNNHDVQDRLRKSNEQLCSRYRGPISEHWRHPSADRQLGHFRRSLHLFAGSVLQFGVRFGLSMREILNAFEHPPAWGFDSFVGLPEEEGGKHVSGDWKVGDYAALTSKHRGRYGLRQREELTSDPAKQAAAMDQMLRQIKGYGQGNLTLVKGFYNVSLTDELARDVLARGGPAMYVDIDCDLYISSIQALDWVFRNGLAKVGTVIAYDDWWVLPCIHAIWPSGVVRADAPTSEEALVKLGGEIEAHYEIARKYNVFFECVCGPCAEHDNPRAAGLEQGDQAEDLESWRVAFVVRNFSRPEGGFKVSPAYIHEFARHSGMCKAVKARFDPGKARTAKISL